MNALFNSVRPDCFRQIFSHSEQRETVCPAGHRTRRTISFVSAVLLMILSVPVCVADGGSVRSTFAVREVSSPAPQPGDSWWVTPALTQLRPNARPIRISMESAIVRALAHSPQIRVFSELPLIRRTAITEAEAAFDWRTFLDSQWEDVSEPVGNSLTVGGGRDRYDNHDLSVSGGFRRRTALGGEFEVAQEFGHQTTNSTFFIPNPQGTSRLTLGFTQPLLRGSGKIYNQSLTCLARIDKDVAESEFLRQLQSHLIEVSRAYWALYLERGLYVQKSESYHRAKEIFTRLEARRNIDVSESQLTSVRASVTERRAELLRSRMAIKNAESRLRTLTGDPNLGTSEEAELIPQDRPGLAGIHTTIEQAMSDAARFRPEVSAALKKLKAGAVRCGMTKHELLPVLNLVTKTYVAGLQYNDPGKAFFRSFTDGSPSYTVGLQFEVPLGRRAARARHERRRLEQRQLKHEYESVLASIRLEVETAVRELETSLQEMDAKGEAVKARKAQLNALKQRWEMLPGQDLSANLALVNLLTSQEKLTAAEHEHLKAIMTYNLAVITLKRVRGTLLQEEGVSVTEYRRCCLPERKAVAAQTEPDSRTDLPSAVPGY